MTSDAVDDLPLGTRAPLLARERARSWLRAERLDALAGDFVLLVSELVANAVANSTAGPIRVSFTRSAGAIRCDVENRGLGVPVHTVVRPDAPSGRGLHLVDLLASRWGSSGVDGSTRVWFELDC